MASSGPLYMGFDLSTQQLKSLVVDSNLKLIHETKVKFDDDLGRYGVKKGVLTNPDEGEVFAPPAMWLDAVDLVLDRLGKAGLDFSRVKGLSGAGMQHGTVFWSDSAEALLGSLDASKPIREQLEPDELDHERMAGAFAHPTSPNWQDASTQQQCDEFNARLGSKEALARVTGSAAHHRFSGPQILRYRVKHPSRYTKTSRISLVSSFLASVFLGRIAPIDVGDVGGMNLYDLNKACWDDGLLGLTAGGDNDSSRVADLKAKLGSPHLDGGEALGRISKYFVTRYGFPADCAVIPFTGDNPATILSLPLRVSDAMVSLGTSTTFLMSTPHYYPDPAYHFMSHPCERKLYMFMLCYKNGGLAREQVRDGLKKPASRRDSRPPGSSGGSWETFNATALATPPLCQQDQASDPMRLGLYFPRPEIVPNLPSGQWRYLYDASASELTGGGPQNPAAAVVEADARTIVESQMLSLRLRSHNLVGEAEGDNNNNHPAASNGAAKPPQPRRVYLVGGGSANAAIAKIAGQVLGGIEGVYKLDIGGNACALGTAYKAVWGCERRDAREGFTDLIGERWAEADFVEKIADGYDGSGVFERYGEAVKGFEMMESQVVDDQEGKLHREPTGGRFHEPGDRHGRD